MLLNARQAHVQTLELVRQPLVVDSQAVKESGVEVVYVDRVFDDVVAKVVRLTVHDTRLDAAAGQPGREALGVVISAVILLG